MLEPARRVATLIACLALAACSSGTVIVVRQPGPPPPPPPPRIEPLEITVARPVRGQLVVQTNRPSYVALFEIVPDRGVALIAPSYAHQRTWMLAGLNWVPVSWKVQSSMYYGRPSGTSLPARWVYAIASDEPLRLPDEAFQPAYLRRVLGPAAYRGTNPYVTMRAIARAFVPSVIDEAWAEDAYALAATYASDPYRTVRIYCANRTVYEVPEEMADRAWCPVRSPTGGTVVRSVPTRPDSIVVGNGQRARRRLPETTPVRRPIDRVSEPTPPQYVPIATENNTAPRKDTTRDVKDVKEKERRGNGNAWGHTDDPTVKGRGIENEKQKDPRRTPVNTPVHQKPLEAEPDKIDVKQDRQEQKQEEKQIRREEKQEEKADRIEHKADKAEQQPEKVEHKPDKPEQKADRPPIAVEPPRQDDTPVTKPDVKPVQKEEDRPVKVEEKQEPKTEPTAEPKEEKVETKAETKEEKAEAKADDKAGGKPEETPKGKPDTGQPGKKDHKSKP